MDLNLDNWKQATQSWIAGQEEWKFRRPPSDRFAWQSEVDHKVLEVWFQDFAPARVAGGRSNLASVLRNQLTAWLLDRPGHQSWTGLDWAAAEAVLRFVRGASQEVIYQALKEANRTIPVPAARQQAWARYTGTYTPAPDIF